MKLNTGFNCADFMSSAKEENGKTNHDVNKALGITHPRISRYCKGKTTPRINDFILIANYFGYEVELTKTDQI